MSLALAAFVVAASAFASAQAPPSATEASTASLRPAYFLRNPTTNLGRLFSNPAQLPLPSADVPVTNLCDPSSPASATEHCRRPPLVTSNSSSRASLSPYAECLAAKCRNEWREAVSTITRAANAIAVAPLSASDVHGGAQLQLCGIRACASELTVQLSAVCVPWSALPPGTTLDRPPDPKEPGMSPDLVARYSEVNTRPEGIGICLPSPPIGSPCLPTLAEVIGQDGLLTNASLPQPVTNGLPDSFAIPRTNISAMYRLPPSLLRTDGVPSGADGVLAAMNIADNTFSLFFCSPADNNTIRPALLPGVSGCSTDTNASCAFTPCLPSLSTCSSPSEFIKRPMAPVIPSTRGAWAFNPLYAMPAVVGVAVLISLFACIQNRRLIRSKKTRSILDRDRALRPADRRMLEVSAVQEAGMVGRPGDVLPRYAHHGFDLRPDWHPPNEEDLIYTDDGVEVAEVPPDQRDHDQDPGESSLATTAAEYDRPPEDPVDATGTIHLSPTEDEPRERAALAALYLAGPSTSGAGGISSSFGASPLSPPTQARTREGSRGVASTGGSLQAQQYRRQRSGMPSQLGSVGRGAII